MERYARSFGKQQTCSIACLSDGTISACINEVTEQVYYKNLHYAAAEIFIPVCTDYFSGRTEINMNFIKKITAAAIAAFAALSFSAFCVNAEEDSQSDNSSDSGYITNGEYKYSLKTFDDGTEAAVLEEYTGSDSKIKLPDTIDEYEVRAIGATTFYENEKITEITISKYIEEIGYFPFYGCTSLMEFKVDEQNETFVADSEGVLLGKDGLSLTSYPTGKNPEKYTVSDGIQAIHSAAFSLCTNLKEINLPDSISYVGIYAFSGCSALESIDLPDNLTELNDFLFSDCSSLTDVSLPENLQVIGSAVFFNCKALENIDFPPSLYEIGQAAFCSTGMTSITIPNTVISIGYSAFGFHTDENEQIVADSNFVINGYYNSYARTYCVENNVDFIPIEEEPTEAADTSKKISSSAIAVICVVCAAVIITVSFVIVKKTRLSGEADSDDDNENTEEE